ncbi:MAG: hypothetical protein Q9188_006482 [Gyalolechia gomerana]
MDPLSVTTGVLTLVGACNALASTIRKLHHLREAPRELGALEKEISALQSCADGISHLVQTHGQSRREVMGQSSIGVCVGNARQKIEEIQQYLDRSLLEPSSGSKIRKSACAESQGNEMQLQKLTSEGRSRHEHYLRILHSLWEEVAAQRPALAFEMKLQLASMSQTMQSTMQDEHSSPVVQIVQRRGSYDYSSKSDNGFLRPGVDRPRSRSEGTTVVLEDNNVTAEDASTASHGITPVWPKSRCSQVTNTSAQNEQTVSLQLSRRQGRQCRRPCSCQCHRSSKLKAPDFLRQITGQLLVGYAGISSITPPCNEYACAQRQQTAVRIQYNFPVWSLIQRALTLVSYAGGACGPEKILRLSRVRPGLDEVFIQVQSGNVRRLQQLFLQGGASPLDASDTGWSLLHYALCAGQLATAKFLKDAGADIRAESTSRETPVDVAWNRILSGCLDEKSEHLLRNVFDDDAQLDERQFTTLHKIVLGMIGNDLASELEVTTAHINAVDSSGNTPLAWASARGDHGSVTLLLEHGASLNIANYVNAKPIHLAAQTGNISTIRVLVQVGADVNSVVHQTLMTPIHYAAEYQNSSEQILDLADLGAQIDGKDYLSWTPLHWSSWRGHLSSLNALLTCGADVNARTLDGNASIILAVANNSHECIHRLIEAGADCSVIRDSQWNVLHYAALGGSASTLRSLTKADLSALDLEGLKTKDTGQSVADMLSSRLEALAIADDDAGEAWRLAWDDLVAPRDTKKVGGLSPKLDPHLVRSDTDSTYFDAEEQSFEHESAR